jgi:oxygen-independent coproporphyrinogen-3 oxidase
MLEGRDFLTELERLDPRELAQQSRSGPRYTSYPTAPAWTKGLGGEKVEQQLELAQQKGADQPLSLYLHLPFCAQMCSYCGCNVVVARRPERADKYIDYLRREMDLVCRLLPSRRRISQLHWGGGTPTFLSEEQIVRLWSEITTRFTLEPHAEVALEIDPLVTSRAQLALLRQLGFNRLSMGIQDFAPDVQAYIGRIQPVEKTRQLYQAARELGFGGINFDLIYGLPKQEPQSFSATLDTVIAMGPDRVAVFGYAHVPWMRPQQRVFDEGLIPRAEARFRLFATACRKLLTAGYHQIGMDHFARPEDELAQARLAGRLHRNFQGYTVQPSTDLQAFGITAISEIQNCYLQNLKPLGRYYRALEHGQFPVERGWQLSAEDRLRRRIIHQIMCNFQVDLGDECRPLKVAPEEVFASDLIRLKEVEAAGLVERQGLKLELTVRGRILVRNVAMVFDAYLERPRGEAPSGPSFSQTL